jgi:hypothetical protein
MFTHSHGAIYMSDPSYTVSEFCAAERISRAMLYKLWSQGKPPFGKGPAFYYIGSVRRISHEARIEWQKSREASSNGGRS